MRFSWSDSRVARPKVFITAEDDDFDEVTLQNWREEGFEASYLPFTGSREDYVLSLQHLADPLELGENFAIVGLLAPIGIDSNSSYGLMLHFAAAYGEAASVVLDLAMKPIPKLCALIAYYPLKLPPPSARFLSSLNVAIHLVGPQIKTPVASCRCYSYPGVGAGFAEEDLDQYDKVSASLAWSRSLAALRKGFDIEVDLEKIWDDHVELEFVTKDADATMSTMVAQPYVNHIPTMTGGIGYKDLHRFYRDYFIPGNPPSLTMKLLSRTVGTDRVVDEMYMSFEHTQVMPWLLPDVDPTNKHVEVALVVIVCIRGGKLYHEHIYWDQASVLVQIGLLDPKLVSGGKGQSRLPVVDGAGARKVVDESSIRSNELISSW